MPKESLNINCLDNSMLGVNYYHYDDIKAYTNTFNLEYAISPSLYIIECKSQDEYDGFINAINLTQLISGFQASEYSYVLISDEEVAQIKETNKENELVTICNTVTGSNVTWHKSVIIPPPE